MCIGSKTLLPAPEQGHLGEAQELSRDSHACPQRTAAASFPGEPLSTSSLSPSSKPEELLAFLTETYFLSVASTEDLSALIFK